MIDVEPNKKRDKNDRPEIDDIIPKKMRKGLGGGPVVKVIETCPNNYRIVSLLVIENATQTNVTQLNNAPPTWVAVKTGGQITPVKTDINPDNADSYNVNWVDDGRFVPHTNHVIVEVTTDPNTPECWGWVQWVTRDMEQVVDLVGHAVDGHPNRRSFSRDDEGRYDIGVRLPEGETLWIHVWIAWAELHVRVAPDQGIHPANDAEALMPGHVFPDDVGGAQTLGPLSSEEYEITYACAIGRMQAVAVLQPEGIEHVVRRQWRMRRTVTSRSWDNGLNIFQALGGMNMQEDIGDENDTSHPPWKDEDPFSPAGGNGLIFDVDTPGCPALGGTNVNRTAEVYMNFWQYVILVLDQEYPCSNRVAWSYRARVDVEKPDGQRTEMNEIQLGHIDLPNQPHYQPRGN